MSPQCPSNYACTFTPLHPRVITHTIGPWWHGGGGLALAIIAVIAIACLLAWVAMLWSDARSAKHARDERERQRKHDEEMAAMGMP